VEESFGGRDRMIIIERNKEMKKPITLYTLSECGRCPIIRMMLDTHNVMYTEIMDDRELMKEKNIENAPALEVGDTIIDNYHDVLRWLIDNNYYGM